MQRETKKVWRKRKALLEEESQRDEAGAGEKRTEKVTRRTSGEKIEWRTKRSVGSRMKVCCETVPVVVQDEAASKKMEWR